MNPFGIHKLGIDGPIQVSSSYGPAPEGVDVLWRAEARRYSYIVDADSEIYGVTEPEIELYWYEVKHWTKGGNARLYTGGGKLVYLGKHSGTQRQWASRTPQEAIQSLIARRQRQIKILKGQLLYAETELALAERAVVA